MKELSYWVCCIWELFNWIESSLFEKERSLIVLTRGPCGPLSLTWVQWTRQKFDIRMEPKTRGPKGHISCTWIQCATFLTDRPGQQFLFIHRPERHKLGRGRFDLETCQVSLNSIQRFQRRSRKYLSQSEARRPSCFSDRPEKHKLGRGCWDLASCQVSLNSVQRFQRRSRKCLSQSEARAAILFFRSARKTQTW